MVLRAFKGTFRYIFVGISTILVDCSPFNLNLVLRLLPLFWCCYWLGRLVNTVFDCSCLPSYQLQVHRKILEWGGGMLRDPLKFLVFSACAMLSMWRLLMFCFQYFPVSLWWTWKIENLQIGTSSKRWGVFYLFNDIGKFSLSSLIFGNTHFWASLVV